MTGTGSKRSADSKAAWKRRSDSGPHTAVFPSGATLTFRIPDAGTLLRAGRLPERLRTTALMCAAHPEGPDGYMADLVMHSLVAADRQELVTQAIEDGIGLGHELVAEMLVDPKVTAEEVAAGDFPELDVKMLLEFAERRRDTDAVGSKLPVIVLRDWAGFRREQPGAGSVEDGGPDGGSVGADGADVDGDG